MSLEKPGIEKAQKQITIKTRQEDATPKKTALINQEIAHVEENYEVFDTEHEYSKKIAAIAEKLRDPTSKEKIQYKVINANKVNAFAVGNTVYVYSGMLTFCKTEAELAYILGHEITHIESGDTYREESSVSQARADEYYADSVLHKLSDAGYNPAAIESMLKTLTTSGKIDYAHGSSADRQAAVRTQLKLKDHVATGAKDDLPNPFEKDKEKIKKESKVGIVDKFIGLAERNSLHKLQPEELDKVSLLTNFKFLGEFYEEIIKRASFISSFDNWIERSTRKRNLAKQMRQMNTFMKYIETRVSKELGITDNKDILVTLFLDFAKIDLTDVAKLKKDLTDEKVRFDFPEGFWGDLVDYAETPQKALSLLNNTSKNSQDIQNLKLVTRKDSRELVIGGSPDAVANLVSGLGFDVRISNFSQEQLLEAIKLNLDEKSTKDQKFFLSVVAGCIKNSCGDLREEFKEFLEEFEKEESNITPEANEQKFNLFKNRYKHIYFSAKKLLNAISITTTTSSLCDLMNPEMRFFCSEQIDMARNIQTEIIKEEMENKPIIEEIKTAISKKDISALEQALAQIDKKDIAVFFGSFSVNDLCRNATDLKFFTDFIHQYLQDKYQISDRHREELFYALVNDKKFNFGKKRSEVWGLVKKDGIEKTMKDLGVSEDIFKPLLSLHVFEMMSAERNLDFDRVVDEKNISSLSRFSKIILAKKFIYMPNINLINSKNFKLIIQSIDDDLQKGDIVYHSQIISHLCVSDIDSLNRMRDNFLKRLEESGNLKNLDRNHIEAIINSIDNLFTKSQKREASQVKSRLRLDLLKLLSFDEALEKIKAWKSDGTLHYTHVDYVQEHLMRSVDQKLKMDNLMKEYIREAKEEHSERGSSLVLLDKSFEDFIDHLYPYGMDAKTVLDAMLNSKYDDTLLRQIMVTFWGVYTQTQFDVSNLDTLENATKYMQNEETFEEYMDSFYKNISENDIEAILAKLLISPRGVMRYSGGVKVILKAIEKEISPEDPEFKKLVLLVAQCGMNSVDPVRIFKPIADILRHRVLKKPPEKGSNKLALKRLKDFHANRATDLLSTGVFDNRKRKIAAKNLMEAQEQIFKERSANQESTSTENTEKSVQESLRKKIIDYSEIYKINEPETVTDPMDYVLALAQNMGAVGVRFLQILGQYIEIPKNYESRFADVFDAQRGQIKWTAIDTIEREAKNGPKGFQEFWSSVTDVSETIGGGSLMTVYKVKSGDKDYVVKVLNPNAQEFIRQNIQDIEKILKNKRGKLGKKFPLTLSLVHDLSSWLNQDISSRHKKQEVDEFKIVAENRKSKMHLPGSIYTGSQYVMIEEFIPGRNLNELQKSDRGSYEGMVKIMIEDYRAQMGNFYADGKTKIHTDPHVGNIRLGNDGELYWLDRGYYIECTKEEMDVVSPILSGKINLSSARSFFDLLLQDEANKGKSKVKIASRFLYRLQSILRGKGDISHRLNIFIKEIGIEIPIRYSLLFKNEAVINKLLK